MAEPTIKILVTGSRGKSSLVRLIHCALSASGIRAYGRITGVVPRQLGPDGVREIVRHSGAHVGEMKWWIDRVRGKAQAVVLENSAVAPDLQGLAGFWLNPGFVVLTNTLADHQEIWGPLPDHAARVLVRGIVPNTRVILPDILLEQEAVMSCLARQKCHPIPVAMTLKSAGSDGQSPEWGDYREENRALALALVRELGLDPAACRRAMETMAPDPYDFCVRPFGSGVMAMAFSANDIESSRRLFRSLGWPVSGTRLLFNHRQDRPGRIESFFRWMAENRWQQVDIIGDRPRKMNRVSRSLTGIRYSRVKTMDGLAGFVRPGDRIFGCGNMAGLPLAIAGSPLPQA